MLKIDFIAAGEESYKAVMENFTSIIMSKKYQNLYKELLNKKEYEK